jgi:hypothetical protein
MKPYQRVALRFAKRLELNNLTRSEKIKYTIKGDVSRYFQVLLYHGRKKIGQVQGGRSSNSTLVSVWEGEPAPIDGLICSKEIRSLVAKYPQVVKLDWKNRPTARILEVSSSGIGEEYHGKRIGIDMYLAFARTFWDKVSKPFIFIPDGCTSVGTTSDQAKRVWASLGRKMPSSGLCLAILKRP